MNTDPDCQALDVDPCPKDYVDLTGSGSTTLPVTEKAKSYACL
jgi:hypothetical protein